MILAFTGGAASLFSLFVLPYASDQCGDPDRYLVCTAIGQNFVVGGPVVAMMLGTVIAAISLTLHPRYRALGIALGYLICFGTFLAALIIAFAP
ncbi:hypothetical protein [Actinoplanes sp. NPDC049681]|uniref:hypothetical protein n=1 Tax=Actinoplanes sp. NPDC049681 TaxID=3363905 RepID=UPI00379A11C6